MCIWIPLKHDHRAVRKGRRIVLTIIVTLLLTDLVLITARAAANGFQYQSLITLILSLILYCYLYKGSSRARFVFMAAASVIAVYAVYALCTAADPDGIVIILGLLTVCITAALVLLLSDSVNYYFRIREKKRR